MSAPTPTELVTKALGQFPLLRYYQLEAIQCTAERLRKTRDPLLMVLPTGAGKSWVIAGLAAVVQSLTKASAGKAKKVLVLAPSAELVEQNHAKMVESGFSASIFSADLGQKDSSGSIIFGSHISVERAAESFVDQGLDFSAVFIDEAHSHPPTVLNTIQILKKRNPNLRVVGLTATPYKLGHGYIFRKDHFRGREPLSDRYARDPFFAELVYDISAHTLIEEGYLTPPVLGDVSEQYDTSKLKRADTGGFTEASGNQVFVNGRNELTKKIVQDVKRKAKTRRGVMFFAQNIKHANQIMSFLPKKQARMIDSKTPKAERRATIADYKARRFKYLVNVGTLTKGFDAPHVDLIAILRATESVALLQQIIGRGLRLCPETGKKDCLILDYAQNIPPDGDIFTPAIQAAMPGNAPDRSYVDVQCPECRQRNTFQKATWPAGTVMNEHGYLVTEAGDGMSRPIMTATNQPLAGHLGVQCSNYVFRAGRDTLARCKHTWGSVECPRCHEVNSKRMAFCHGCDEPLSKGARRLQVKAGSTRDSAYAQRVAAVTQWRPVAGQSRNGLANLRIIATVQELPYFAPEPPDTSTKRKEGEREERLVLHTPEPETISLWLNPLVDNPRAQAAWDTYLGFVRDNVERGVFFPDEAGPADLVGWLADGTGGPGVSPQFLIYRQQPPREGVDRVFHEAVSYHLKHPYMDEPSPIESVPGQTSDVPAG